MAYGVTPSGFVRPRFPEIRSEITTTLRENLIAAGYPGDIITTSDTVFGVLIDTFSEREAALWEKAEEVYLSRFPSSAQGTNLDRALELGGYRRKGVVYSTTYLEVDFDTTTFQPIPSGFRIRDRFTERIWGVSKEISDPLDAVTELKFTVSSFNTPTVYSFKWGTFEWSNPVPEWTIPDEIARHLILFSLKEALEGLGLAVSHEVDGAYYTSLTVKAPTREYVKVEISSNFEVQAVSSIVPATVLTPYDGSPAPGNPFDKIDDAPHWLSAETFIQGVLGHPEQDDAAFLADYRAGGAGVSTLPAIDANLRARVPAIIESKVYQNDSDQVSPEGMLPHSIYAVVLGGDSGLIADALYKLKAAGIDTNALLGDPYSQIVTLETPQGLQTIAFDRPQIVYVSVLVRISPIDDPPSGEWPVADGPELVNQGVREYFKMFEEVGKDVRYQILLGGVYRDVPGVGNVELRLAASYDPREVPALGDYFAGNVTIAFNELARLARVNVEVL